MNKKTHDCMTLAVMLAGEMIRCGGETYRAEECCATVLKAFGADSINIMAFPTAVIASADVDGESRTESVSVKSRNTDLDGIAKINSISRKLSAGQMSLEDGFEAIKEKRKDSFLLLSLYASLSAGFFALVFGGTWVDFLPSIIAAMLAQLFKRFADRISGNSYLSTMGGCMITAGFARLAVWVYSNCNMDAVIIGGIMSMLPGLAITNALRDSIHGDTVSGVARGAEALVIGVTIAAGVAIVLAF